MKRVVVSGIGVVSPIGSRREEFFNNLSLGINGIGPITLFDAGTFPVKMAGEVKELDAVKLCRENPVLDQIKDRKVLLGFMAAADALEDAETNSDDCSKMGLNLGVSLESVNIGDVADLLVHRTGARIQTPLDTLNRMLIRRYRLGGPGFINCSACVASTQAVGHSFQKIRAGEAVMFLAGGFDSMINPLGIGGFSLLGALSTRNENNACRPFDKEREGAVLGEGAAMLVLEEREHALARGARIYCEISGYAATMDSFKVTDPHPGGAGAAAAMEMAVKDAGISADAIGHINAHGTSTWKNDLVETIAIKKVFGPRAYEIPISSVKSMTGHLIGAAGALETCAAIYTLTRNSIPPTINYHTPDPECDLNYTPNKGARWDGEYILKNSFAFGGQNACLILRRHG